MILKKSLQLKGSETDAWTSDMYTGFKLTIYIKNIQNIQIMENRVKKILFKFMDFIFNSQISLNDISKEINIIGSEEMERSFKNFDHELVDHLRYKLMPHEYKYSGNIMISNKNTILSSSSQIFILLKVYQFLNYFYSPHKTTCIILKNDQLTFNINEYIQEYFNCDLQIVQNVNFNCYLNHNMNNISNNFNLKLFNNNRMIDIIENGGNIDNYRVGIGFVIPLSFDKIIIYRSQIELLAKILCHTKQSLLLSFLREKLAICYSVRYELIVLPKISLLTFSFILNLTNHNKMKGNYIKNFIIPEILKIFETTKFLINFTDIQMQLQLNHSDDHHSKNDKDFHLDQDAEFSKINEFSYQLNSLDINLFFLPILIALKKEQDIILCNLTKENNNNGKLEELKLQLNNWAQIIFNPSQISIIIERINNSKNINYI